MNNTQFKELVSGPAAGQGAAATLVINGNQQQGTQVINGNQQQGFKGGKGFKGGGKGG
jgi:hypothetical protein